LPQIESVQSNHGKTENARDPSIRFGRNLCFL
jgi:hypothetical protein